MKNELIKYLGKNSPALVASLDGEDLAFLIEQAKTDRADMVEIRLDLWGRYLRDDFAHKFTRFKQKIGIPMIVSFRGGNPFPSWWKPLHWNALKNAAVVDFEWNPKYPWREIQTQVKRQHLGLLISHHDLKGTPKAAALAKMVKAAFKKKADIVKVATLAKSEMDLQVLHTLNQTFAKKGLVATMAMGPLGPLSRVSGPLYRTCLVYGYIGYPTAPGQLPYLELSNTLRRLYPRYAQSYQNRMTTPLPPF